MRTYCIVSNPATPEQYSAAIERQETARESLDGSEVVLKWGGSTPAPFAGLPTLTHAEAVALMATAEWSDEA
jgi:hypothetical protein